MVESHQEMLKLSALRVRDPFILADPDTQTYYLCTSLYPNEKRQRSGVGVYTSHDLERWEGPITVFEMPEIEFQIIIIQTIYKRMIRNTQQNNQALRWFRNSAGILPLCNVVPDCINF